MVSSAAVLSFGLAVVPTLACERHQQHVSTTPAEIASTVPLVIADPAPEQAAAVVTPTAAPQSPPITLRKGNCNYSRTTQALTQ
jgi:hypothetical protein